VPFLAYWYKYMDNGLQYRYGGNMGELWALWAAGFRQDVGEVFAKSDEILLSPTCWGKYVYRQN
jgi:hypothetical protein